MKYGCHKYADADKLAKEPAFILSRGLKMFLENAMG